MDQSEEFNALKKDTQLIIEKCCKGLKAKILDIIKLELCLLNQEIKEDIVKLMWLFIKALSSIQNPQIPKTKLPPPLLAVTMKVSQNM
eukprot:1001763-Ditylum_brightwellii.AAC.1